MNFLDGLHLEILLGIFTLLITTYLGVVVYFKNKKSWTSRFFLILSVLIDCYIIINYISLHPPHNTGESQLFWIRIVMFVCSFIGPAEFFLAYNFPRDKFILKKKYLILILILMVASASASLLPLVFTSISYSTGEPLPTPGVGMPIFLLDFVGLFLFSFITLIIKYRKATGKERTQNLYFILGVIATFSFMTLSAVVSVVIFKTSATVFLGPLSAVMLMLFIAYSIFKYNLFNIRLIATEAIIVFLTIILLTEGVVSGSLAAILFKFFFALLVAILGVLLIRSVKKEIEQRDRLQKITKELQIANTNLKELDKQKSEFLSIASHQLRTPLSIAKGYIELLQDGAYGNVDPEAKKILTSMDVSNENLIRLVGEFLNISRIEQGRESYDFKPCDLKSIVNETVEEFCKNNSSLKHKINWHPTCDGNIVADAEKIRNVVYNFIDNAIKYGDGKSVDIKLDCDQKTTTFRVIDHGLGFGKEDKDAFFQKFYRGFNVRHTNINGVGLGLFACKKFIESHKGKVWAKSDGLNKGSEFGFSIPLKSR